MVNQKVWKVSKVQLIGPSRKKWDFLGRGETCAIWWIWSLWKKSAYDWICWEFSPYSEFVKTNNVSLYQKCKINHYFSRTRCSQTILFLTTPYNYFSTKLNHKWESREKLSWWENEQISPEAGLSDWLNHFRFENFLIK